MGVSRRREKKGRLRRDARVCYRGVTNGTPQSPLCLSKKGIAPSRKEKALTPRCLSPDRRSWQSFWSPGKSSSLYQGWNNRVPTRLTRKRTKNGDKGTPLKELEQVLPSHSRSQLQVLMRELKRDELIYVVGKTSAARWFAH